MPWTCKGCDEVIEDTFEECWNCGTDRQGHPARNEELFVNADVSFSEADSPIRFSRESTGDVDSEGRSGQEGGRVPTLTAPRPVLSSTAQRLAARAGTRYSDAYLVASAIIGLASVIKVLGLVAALAVWGTGTVLARALGTGSEVMAVLIGFIPGAIVAVVAYGIGVIVSAQGQILRASLDSAVHSSPFLGDKQRVQIMSL